MPKYSRIVRSTFLEEGNPMRRLRFDAALGLATAFVASLACQPQSTSTGPSLSITANPRTIPNTSAGSSAISVTAGDAKGNAGTGSVVLTVPSGSLGTSGTSQTLTLANGIATTTYSCDVARDATCIGTSKLITASWNGTSASASVLLALPDAGSSNDGGSSDAGGNSDAGSDAGTGFGNGTVLTIAASKPEIIVGIGDSASIRAVLSADGGGPLAGQTLDFTTSLGLLTGANGVPGPSTTATTAIDGSAVVTLSENGDAGTATITASHPASGAMVSLLEPIVLVKSITWVSTTCSSGGNTVPCTFLGLKGTGFQEQAQVTFLVTDAVGNPIVGAKVTFSILNAGALGLTFVSTATTNGAGQATTTVSSGSQIGAFAVNADVIPNVIQTQSPTLGVVGVYPTNATMTFDCDTQNIPAYVSNNPPAAYTANCTITLADRFNNRVGTGTSVFFKTESGTVPNSVKTVAFDPNNPTNPAMGTGVIQFQTTGGTWPPIDVAPFPALTSAQQPFPGPRQLEPSYTDMGGVTRNPRDGLITIMAYVTGEKWYSDTNGNGSWDLGEPFVDQGDPYLDSNDDNIRGPNELCIGSGPDGGCQGTSGTYAGNVNVWIETRILVTDRPAGGFSVSAGSAPYVGLFPNPFAAPCDGGLTPGGQVGLEFFAPDFQINKPYAGTTFMAPLSIGTAVSVTTSGATLDGYGFGYQRSLIDVTNNQHCIQGTTPICEWATLFTVWGQGSLESAVVVTDKNTTGKCENDIISPSTTCLSVTNVYASDPGGAN